MSGVLTGQPMHDRGHRVELSLGSPTKRRLADRQRDDPEYLDEVERFGSTDENARPDSAHARYPAPRQLPDGRHEHETW